MVNAYSFINIYISMILHVLIINTNTITNIEVSLCNYVVLNERE